MLLAMMAEVSRRSVIFLGPIILFICIALAGFQSFRMFLVACCEKVYFVQVVNSTFLFFYHDTIKDTLIVNAGVYFFNCPLFSLFPRAASSVVYFNQQTGAPHAVCWSKSFFWR